MKLAVSEIVTGVRHILQDTGADRWTNAQLFHWLYEGQLAVLALAPVLFSERTIIPMTATAEQTIPVGSHMLLQLIGVCDANGKVTNALTPISEAALFLEDPAWMDGTPAMPLHSIRKTTEHQTFYLYPVPAQTGFLLVDHVPAISKPDSLQDELTLVDESVAAILTDYVLFRAFGEDADNQHNEGFSLKHKALYEEGMQKIMAGRGALK